MPFYEAWKSFSWTCLWCSDRCHCTRCLSVPFRSSWGLKWVFTGIPVCKLIHRGHRAQLFVTVQSLQSYRHMFTASYVALQPPTTSDDITSHRSWLSFIGSLFVLELNFNISLITFKERLGLALTYITEMLNQLPVSDLQVGSLLVVPKSEAEIQKVTERSPSGPLRLWNKLPEEMRPRPRPSYVICILRFSILKVYVFTTASKCTQWLLWY